MQYFPQQQFGGFFPQAQQCLSCPFNNNNNNNFMPGLFQQQQQQFPGFGGFYPQQNFGNPFAQQQLCYPQQQQQFYYPQFQQQQQQQQYPFYPQQQQQWPNFPVSFLGQNAGGYQQFWPQHQQRVYEDAPTPLPPVHHKKGKSKKH